MKILIIYILKVNLKRIKIMFLVHFIFVTIIHNIKKYEKKVKIFHKKSKLNFFDFGHL